MRDINSDLNYPDLQEKPPDAPEAKSAYDRLLHCLKSGFPPLVIWALNRFPMECQIEKRAVQLLPTVTSLFCSQSKVVEFKAVSAVTEVAKVMPKKVAGHLLTVLMDRMNECPAVEYSVCLAYLVPHFTEATIMSCIVPLSSRFLEKGDPYHVVVGELVTRVTPFSSLRITYEQLTKFLTSPVIVKYYLVGILKCSVEPGALNEEWRTKVYPMQLIQTGKMSPALRPAVMQAIIAMGESLPHKQFMNYVQVGVQWSTESAAVAIALLENADEVVTPKTVELLPKLRQLMGLLCQSSDPRVRMLLPKIIARNSSLFMGGNMDIQEYIMALARDRVMEVRIVFMENFASLFERSKSQVVQDALFRVFLEYFDDESPAILKRLCNSAMYKSLGAARLHQVLPKFYKFFSNQSQWRDQAECMKAYMEFPCDVIAHSWRDILPIVFNAVSENPRVLCQGCQVLCCRVLSSISSTDKEEVVERVISAFAKSDNYRMRVLFPRISASIAMVSQSLAALDVLWDNITTLAYDQVIDVKASVVSHILKFRQFYVMNNNPKKVDEVMSLFQSFGQERDPYIHELWVDKDRILSQQLKPKVMEMSNTVEMSRSLHLSKADLKGVNSVSVVTSSSDARNLGHAGLYPAMSYKRQKATTLIAKATKGLSSGGSSVNVMKGCLMRRNVSRPDLTSMPPPLPNIRVRK